MTQETKGYALKLYNRELMSFNLSYDRFANLKVEVYRLRSQHKEALAYGNESREFGKRHRIMGKIQDHPEEPEVCGRDIGYGWSISQ